MTFIPDYNAKGGLITRFSRNPRTFMGSNWDWNFPITWKQPRLVLMSRPSPYGYFRHPGLM